MKLPKEREDLHWSEKESKPSVTVLVRMTGDSNMYQGYYSYGLGEWFVEGFHGSWKVSEWWDLPEIRTGNNVEV